MPPDFEVLDGGADEDEPEYEDHHGSMWPSTLDFGGRFDDILFVRVWAFLVGLVDGFLIGWFLH